MAGVRLGIGAAVLVAPRATSRLLGFPAEHDNATARLMGRLFAVREIMLGALVLGVQGDPATERFAYKLNAWVDAGDASAMAVALVGRRGIDGPALRSAAMALTGVAAWTRLARAEEASRTPGV